MARAGQAEPHTATTVEMREAEFPFSKTWLLAGIVALALVMRVLLLQKSLWLDEGIAVANAWAGGLPLNIWRDWFRDLWQHGEFNMVLYFAVLRVWLRAGSSEVFIRLLSVIPAIATVPLVYAIGKRLFSSHVGLVAAVLLAVHGAHISYSQEARGYTLVVFFCAASTYFFIRGLETGSAKFWILYWLAATLGIYTHLFAALVLAAHWMSLPWAPRRSIPWLKLVLSTVAIVAASGPALMFVTANQGQHVAWIQKPGLSQVVNVISELAGSPVALPAYLVLWVAGMSYCRRVWRERHRDQERWAAALIVSWAIVPLFLALLVSFKKPMLVPRYLLISAPASVLLAALGAWEMSAKRRRIALWATVVLSVGFVLFRYTRPKENWRGATRYVISQAQSHDGIVVLPEWSKPVFDYYRNRSVGTQPAELPPAAFTNGASFVNAASHYPRLWVIVYRRDYAMGEPDSKLAQANLETHFTLLEHHDFTMLQVRLYIPSEPVNRLQ